MAKADDETILEAARVRRAAVVTLDADFHSILARSNATSPSVIRIRIEGIKGDRLARIIERVVDLVGKDLVAGAAITVSNSRLALRRLPIMTPDKGLSEPAN